MNIKKGFVRFAVVGILAAGGVASANELYFTMPINYDGQETDTAFIYGVAGTTGTVTSPNGFSSAFTIGANGVTSVVIPSSFDLTTSGAVTNNGFVIATTDPSANVGASYLSREAFTTDTTYLLDATALGTSYYAVGYQSIGLSSQLSIVGTQNGTTVTITPSHALDPSHPAGTPFTVTLNAGQAILFNSSTDVSGTLINASANVAIFGGNQCTDVPIGSQACDHLLSALPSIDHYTTSAVIATTFGTEGSSAQNPDGNLVRVLAASNGTTVTYNGATIATLNAGQYADFNSGGGGVIAANNPILLNEYLTGQTEHNGTVGDPAQSYIPGTDQWLSDYVFSTPVGNQAYQTNFLDLAIPVADIGSITLNGSSVPISDCKAIAGSAFDSCEISIAPGAGEIKASSPFLALVNGGTDFDSYFTFLGTTFSAGASPPPPPPPPPGVPEPSTLALVALGLLGAAGTMRRRASR